MFTQPPPSLTAGLLSPATDAAASSPPSSTSRGSRLRGFSYLRTYTQNHLLSRDSSGVSAQSQSSASDPIAGSPSPHPPPPTRAATGSVSGRRRSRQSVAADDPLSNPRDRLLRTTSDQNPPVILESEQTALAEANSDSDSGRGKKHKTGTENPEEDQAQSSTDADMTRTRSATTGDLSLELLPSIRFSAHYDPRSTRQSLSFTPISRTLPTGKESIKVGRYSEREQQQIVPANTPSAAPVGFKSKVVSRRHCEFWHEDGKWYIKDVKSSSGTFLNHIRLSPPGNESKPYVVNDGDIVQLGIDFRGGEEMIFRCVKMRIELNRGWQNKPNNFNMATHKRLRNLTSTDPGAGAHAQDCSICLNAIAPCQSLFVAPCSHTWHYKCIRELLSGPSYPIFTCPNCRAAADLDADIEEPDEEWQQLDSGAEDVNMETSGTPEVPEPRTDEVAQDSGDVTAEQPPSPMQSSADGEAGDVTMMLDHAPTIQEPAPRREVSSPVPIPRSSPIPVTGSNGAQARRTPSPPQEGRTVVHEGPLTPRNDAGPWVFDGDAGRASQDVSRPGAMVNLDAAATQLESNAS